MRNTWEKFYKKRGRFYLIPHPKLAHIIAKFKLYKVHKVLDLGCGSGRHSIALAKEGFKVIGIDFAKEAISLAKKWAKKEDLKIKFIIKNFTKKFPFKDKSLDAVVAIDALHYDSTESTKFALSESNRILKDSGLIFVTLPTQICNPLVTHLIFTPKEIKKYIEEHFKILEKFVDKRKFMCVLGIKRN